jgi:hypothetical protein
MKVRGAQSMVSGINAEPLMGNVPGSIILSGSGPDPDFPFYSNPDNQRTPVFFSSRDVVKDRIPITLFIHVPDEVG